MHSIERLEDGQGGVGSRVAFVEARGLTRSYGPIVAVDQVDFSLECGAFLTVFGPNGAGKSTLLGLLSGGLRPTSGQVHLGGLSVHSREVEVAHRIGVLSHQGYLYGHLTAEENLRFFGRLFGLIDLSDRIPERLEQVGLSARADHRVRTFSRGMRQRLALARCLLHDPELVLLDEPYTGLDAHAADVLRGVLAALKDGRRTVVLVTHALEQGLALADRVAVQVAGRWAMDAPRSEVGESAAFERRYRALVEEIG